MCEYCENGKEIYIKIKVPHDKEINGYMQILNKKLMCIVIDIIDICLGKYKIPVGSFSENIKFCPMCGRKLE